MRAEGALAAAAREAEKAAALEEAGAAAEAADQDTGVGIQVKAGEMVEGPVAVD